jgi:hypothetical protein
MYYGLPTTFGGTYTEITAATKTPVQKDSSGAFLITKPFDTYGTTPYQFEFDLIASIEDQIAAEESRALAAEGVLASDIADVNTRVDNVLSNVDGVALNSLAEIVTAFQAADSDLNGAITLLASDLDTRIDGVDSTVAAIDARLTTAESDIDAEELARQTLEDEFDTYVTGNNAALTILEGRVQVTESSIAQIQSEIAGLGAVAWYSEKFIVNSTILSNGFVTLSNIPISGSIVANVDRLSIFEGASEDFEMSGDVMTFLNQLVSPGNQALQIGDEIRVKYQA